MNPPPVCSCERRIAKLGGPIEDVQPGRLAAVAQLNPCQRHLDVHDPPDEMTADEEGTEDGREEHEVAGVSEDLAPDLC